MVSFLRLYFSEILTKTAFILARKRIELMFQEKYLRF